MNLRCTHLQIGTALATTWLGHSSLSVEAYLLLGNAAVYKVDPSATDQWAEAIAIDDNGVITGVGTEADLRSSLGNETEYWDLEGRLVLPGFQDSHLHAVEAGVNSQICAIYEDEDLYDIPHILANDCPNGGIFGDQEWVLGAGIDIALLEQIVWDEDYDWPIDVLDAEFPDTPVLILDNLGHGAVVNTKAMERAGMLDYVGNPPGGKLDRDPETGDLTGIVRENAQQPFRSLAFPPSGPNMDIAYQSLMDAVDVMVAYGITTVSDAGGFWKQAQTESWERAESEGTLKVRSSNAFYIYPDIPLDEQLTELQTRFSNDKSRLVRFNQAKIYVDGILSLLTSALFEPYDESMQLPEGDELGFEYFGNSTYLQKVSDELVGLGYQLHFHVTGDRGASIALDMIENLPDSSTGPHRLTHCYLVDEADRGRFAELNVVADFQLAPSSLDPSYEESIAEILDSERASQLLPAKEVYDANALVVLSSDWDADELSPLIKMKAVLTRGDGKDLPDLATVVKMLTINPAILLQHDDITGSITVGKFADLAIVSENIFEVDVNDIDKAEVLVTLLGGDRVYDPDGLYGDVIGVRPLEEDSSVRLSTMFSAVVGLILAAFVMIA